MYTVSRYSTTLELGEREREWEKEKEGRGREERGRESMSTGFWGKNVFPSMDHDQKN